MAVPFAWMRTSRCLASKERNHRDEVSHEAGQKVLAALMEADRVALCGAKGVPSSSDPLQVRSMLDMRHPKCWKPATRNARKRPLNMYRCATSELRVRGHQLSWTDTD